MKHLEKYVSLLRSCAEEAPDKRRGQNTQYSMSDICLAAFSVFFMQSPSFLSHQRTLESLHGRSNLQTLFHNVQIPTDNHIRKMLDGVPTAHFDPVFFHIASDLQSNDMLKEFKVLNDNVLIALDGSEYFSSYKIKCPNCSARKHGNGETEYFHSFLGAVLVSPSQSVALPLPPEFVSPQDGAKKQDCEQKASARWLSKHMASVKSLKPIFLGDDLYAHQPFCEKVLANEASFIFTCKPSSHKTIEEYISGVELETLTVSKPLPGKGKRNYQYQWLENVPVRDELPALKVNWISLKITDPAGKKKGSTYSFITDIKPTKENIEELISCARTRWKIENETFNVLKNNGYNLEHNFGHGRETLAALLVVFNLLAFTIHSACRLTEHLWQEALKRFSAKNQLFSHLWLLAAYHIFKNWTALLSTIATGKPPPPLP